MITLERDWERALGIRPSVSAVIFDDRGRLLLQQRSDGGQWGLPGGSVEVGESVADNVCFECAARGGKLQTCDETLALGYFPPRRLPAALLASHRVRIRAACARRVAPFVR